MANTVFPGAIDTLPTMMDIEASDGPLVKQYQDAMIAGDLALAKATLAKITNYGRKIITADYLNVINTAIPAMEEYTLTAYSPAYIVSSSQPTKQADTDFWFEVTG